MQQLTAYKKFVIMKTVTLCGGIYEKVYFSASCDACFLTDRV